MPLDIAGADVAYDSAGASSLLQKIHAECIEDASNALDSNYNELETATRDCWAGKGADNFLENVKTDINVVKQALQMQYEILEGEINATTSQMKNIDENLVQKR